MSEIVRVVAFQTLAPNDCRLEDVYVDHSSDREH
jgi:hypothetical protein